MNIYHPYTYLIGWKHLNKWYYGVRFSKKAHPSELWVTYFTSSKHVKNFRKEHGEPDVILIRKIFDCQEKARLWEHKVLKRCNVIHDDKWLNKSNNRSVSPEYALIGAKNRKPYKPDDPRYEICRRNGRNAVKYLLQNSTKEARQKAKIKEWKTKKENWNSYVDIFREGGLKAYATSCSRNKQKNFSNNNDAKMLYEKRLKEGTHPNNDTTCPHCGKIGQYRAMKRWHFDNCKHRTKTL